MKPGISSCYFDMLDAYEMAKTFVECGYDQTEINEEHYKCFYREKDVRAYRRYIDELGFFIPQGHLVYMNEGNITSYDNTYAVDRLKKNLEVFYELGNAEVPLEIKKIQAKYLLEVYNTYFAFFIF